MLVSGRVYFGDLGALVIFTERQLVQFQLVMFLFVMQSDIRSELEKG